MRASRAAFVLFLLYMLYVAVVMWAAPEPSPAYSAVIPGCMLATLGILAYRLRHGRWYVAGLIITAFLALVGAVGLALALFVAARAGFASAPYDTLALLGALLTIWSIATFWTIWQAKSSGSPRGCTSHQESEEHGP